MRSVRALTLLCSCASAALAQDVQPVLDRPMTLTRGALDLTLHGTYTDWGSSVAAGVGVSGGTIALGLDYGASDRAQLGVALALPAHPGFGFGSVVGSAGIAAGRTVAVRADVGLESIGLNGDVPPGGNHTTRFAFGFGAPLKVPLAPGVAFVSGRTGAVQFGHFNNIGSGGTGLYLGGAFFTQLVSDNFVFAAGNNNSSSNIGINLPAGLLLQADPHLSVTLQTGYSAIILAPSGASTATLHFVPLSIEAVVSPTSRFDVGARFSLDGYVANTNFGGPGPGYFDMRELMFWLRFRS